MVTNLNEIEQRVFQELRKVDSAIADMYYGAIQVLDRDSDSNINSQNSEINILPTAKYSNPDKLAQASHSIREALNHLFRRIEVPETDKAPHLIQEALNHLFKSIEALKTDKAPHSIREALNHLFKSIEALKTHENFRARIRKFADPQESLPDYLYQPHDKLFELHDWFVKVSHHGYLPTEEEFNKHFELCNSILLRILTPHFESESEIDAILSEQKPTEEQLQKLKSLMTSWQLYNYVFRNAGPQWLSLLKNGQFFKNLHLPKHSGKYAQFPSRPESQYLARIANELPKDVCEIISECSIPEDKNQLNPRVFENFVDAGIKMPCEYASQLGKLIVEQRWEDPSPFSLLGEKISDLMTRLSDECNDIDLAIELGNLILDVDLVSVNPTGRN